MVRNKMMKLVGLAMAAVLALSACAPAADNSSGTQAAGSEATTTTSGSKRIVSALTSDPGILDPATAEGTHQSYPLRNMFVGLTRNTAEGTVENALAEEIKISEDGLKYTVTLKDGIKWSNGEPITAHDFEYSWKRVLKPELAADYAYMLYHIKGGEEYNKGEGSVDDVAIKATDDKTLEFELKSPVAYFKSIMAFYTLYPISKAVDEANPDWAKSADTFVSNGAFKITRWEPNAKVVLDKNEHYYEADKVKLDGIDWDIIEDSTTVYSKYTAGEYNFVVDVPTEVVGQLRANNDPELTISKNFALYYYNLNPAVKPLNNLKVRKALSLAIDRKVIVENITMGGQLPAAGIVPPGVLDDAGKNFSEANAGMVKTDLEEAKKLMAEGLAEEGMTAADVNLTIMYNTSESHKKIAEAIQQMWNKGLGVNITIENVEFKVKLDREETKDYQISRSGWVGDYIDPMTFADLWLTGAPQNYVSYSEPEYDALVKEAQTSSDNKLRMDNMKAAEKMLLEDASVIPIYYYTHPYLAKSNVVGVKKPVVEYPNFIEADIQ